MKNIKLKHILIFSLLLHFLLLMLLLKNGFRSHLAKQKKESFVFFEDAPTQPQQAQQQPAPPIKQSTTPQTPVTVNLVPFQGPNPADQIFEDTKPTKNEGLTAENDESMDSSERLGQPLEQKHEQTYAPQNTTPTPKTNGETEDSTPDEPQDTPQTLLLEKNSNEILNTNSLLTEPFALNPPKEASQKSQAKKASHEPSDSLPFNLSTQNEPLANKRPSSAKKSILSMTSGYLRSLTTTGNSIVEKKGEDRMPSFEELRYLSYQQKVDAHLMNSWRITSGGYKQMRPSNQVTKHTSISLEINQDGTLAFLNLIESSCDPEFDRLVMLSINNAVPFPPIPAHLGITRYRPTGGTYHVR